MHICPFFSNDVDDLYEWSSFFFFRFLSRLTIVKLKHLIKFSFTEYGCLKPLEIDFSDSFSLLKPQKKED